MAWVLCPLEDVILFANVTVWACKAVLTFDWLCVVLQILTEVYCVMSVCFFWSASHTQFGG